MLRKIGLIIIIVGGLWGIANYIIPTFFIKARLLNKIEDKESLSIIPKEKLRDFKINHPYIQKLKNYSLGSLSFSIPQEYELYSSKANSLIFKIDAKNVIMITIMKSNVTSLNNRFKTVSGRFPQIRALDTYQLMRRAMYSSPAKPIMTESDAVYLAYKAILLGPKEHIKEIFEYETENLKGFMIISQMNGNQIKRFEMFSKKDDWISIIFLSSVLSQKKIDSILSTFNY